MFHRYLIQLSTRCLTCNLRWDASRVRDQAFYEVSDLYLTLGCVTGTWSSSLRGVFDIYFTLGCYPGPSSSSLRDVFDLYLMLGCFAGPWSSSLRLRGVYELYLMLGCFSCTSSSSLRLVSLVHNVRMFPRVLSQALDEVCLTCTLH